MKIKVISLGGSIIMPGSPNFRFLDNFKKILRRHYKSHKFVVVCGGGKIARDYITALEKEGKSEKELSLAGIRATRMNSLFMMQFFGKDANETLPLNMEDVKSHLAKNRVVFCGALRFTKNSTSDSTAAKLAHFLKSDFINITNVLGLYTSDPKANKSAELIKHISWKNFDKMIGRIKFHAGQHFVLDQQASKIIKKNRIKTYIIGSNEALDKILCNKPFTGTLISN